MTRRGTTRFGVAFAAALGGLTVLESLGAFPRGEIAGAALRFSGAVPRKADASVANRLYRQRADGTFADVTGSAGVTGEGYGVDAAVGAYDNDGDDAPMLAPLAPYTNPVIITPGRHSEVADPFVLKWNGEYYLYTSGDPVTAYHSTDLVRWTFIGPVLSSSADANAWNGADVWAPEVVYRNGRFYMHYTAARRTSDWRVGEATRRIGVAVADSPRGPFVDIGTPLTPTWGIDGHVFRDPDSGDDFLFYSFLEEPRRPGASIVVDRMPTPVRVAGAPTLVTRGDSPWEDKDGDPFNGSLRYTNEAPTVVKRDGRYYMFYSGGSWDLSTYALAYASSDTIARGDLDGPGWRKAPPILRSTPLVDAPGHDAVVKAPNNVDDVHVYHARVVPFTQPGSRLPFVDRLFWHRDRPFVPQPSLGHAPVPERPLFEDRFDRADGVPGTAWAAEGGDWRIAGQELHQGRDGEGLAAIAVPAPALVDFVFEANIRGTAGSSGPASRRVGVRAFAAGTDRVDVWLDAGGGTIGFAGEIGGRPVEPRNVPVPAAFRWDVYHQLLVTRSHDRLEVALDGVRTLAETFALGGRPTTVALLTWATRAAFDGIAVTASYEDDFADPSAGAWTYSGVPWAAGGGVMLQAAGGGERQIALRGEAAASYEFTASFRWRDFDARDATVGIVAAATDAGEPITCGVTRDLWPFARLVLHRVRGDTAPAVPIAVGLPRGFDYDAWHTMRVVKDGERLTVFLDGAEAVVTRTAAGPARPGLFTHGARAEFDDVRMTRLVVARNLVLDGGFESEQWNEAGEPLEGNGWTFDGAARANACCAHSGLRRAIVTAPGGAVRQVLTGLSRGEYVLHARLTATGSAAPDATVTVTGAGPPAGVEVPVSGRWSLVTLPFSVPTDDASVTVAIAARPRGPGELVAIDDVYAAAVR